QVQVIDFAGISGRIVGGEDGPERVRDEDDVTRCMLTRKRATDRRQMVIERVVDRRPRRPAEAELIDEQDAIRRSDRLQLWTVPVPRRACQAGKKDDGRIACSESLDMKACFNGRGTRCRAPACNGEKETRHDAHQQASEMRVMG
ncbi:MAG: hypothetical protein NDJ92_10800, partial [Thermoanaerobaculia bacterium]|nr:hypothetical protein [Thermoanaerobaculia bacterium]